MNKQIYYIITLLLLLTKITFAQEKADEKVSWNGYTQLRFSSNFNDINSFAMRRMKLWVKSTPEFNAHWGYKVQSTITSLQNEKFMLQDVLVYFQHGNFDINLGQFIPQFSLQRFQSDAVIPLTERAAVINSLVPNGTLGVRDIGIEGKFMSRNKNVETWLGLFNGYGIKEYRFDNTGILITHKAAFHLVNQHGTLGYSIMFRKSDQLKLSSVLPDSVLFTGNDLRYNLFAKYRSEKFQIQAEYLCAQLDNKISDGYYIMTGFDLGKSQFVASWNQYNDLIESTDDYPIIHFAYNYLFNKEKLKIMLDNEVQVVDKNLKNYFLTIQLQLFFN